MALNSIIRRAATSKVVPLAIRVVGGSQRCYHHHHTGSALLSAVNRNGDLVRNVLRRSFPVELRRYSSRPASDESLVRVLQDEIKCAEEDTDDVVKAEEVPQGFPFKIEDNPGQQTVTLSRNYEGETIIVEVHSSSLVTGEEEDNQDDDDDDEKERASQSQIPLVVRISKKTGPSLEFGCTAYPDEISIDSLSLKDPDTSEDQLAYEGPDFLDLDENLQKAFHKYLEIRGIKPSTTNFLHEYMINKDSKEYLLWLKNLKGFVEV